MCLEQIFNTAFDHIYCTSCVKPKTKIATLRKTKMVNIKSSKPKTVVHKPMIDGHGDYVQFLHAVYNSTNQAAVCSARSKTISHSKAPVHQGLHKQ